MRSFTATMNDDVGRVSLLIRQLRMKRGWTQKQLALKANVTARTISNLEREANANPYGSTMAKVAKALGVPPEHFDPRRLGESVAEAATSFVKREVINGLLDLSDSEMAKVLEYVARLQKRRQQRRRAR